MSEREFDMKSFDEIRQRLLAQPVKKKIAVVMANHEHTIEALHQTVSEGLVAPVLIGDEMAIRDLLARYPMPEDIVTIIHEPDAVQAAQMAADMVRHGEADCIMKGGIETGPLMRVLVNRERGIRRRDTMSLLAFMQSPYYHKVFAITDVGLLTYPTLEQKAMAIENALEALRALGVEEPKVAVLAAVEKVNPKMPEAVEAAQLKEMAENGRFGRCIVEGPISYDLAMDPDAAALKGYVSPVAGDPDLLVVPDIVSGNVLAKSLTCTGGAKTCGTVLGAMAPLILTSRSATADDKYMSILLGALIGGQQV